jgi:hypothetical protein
MTFASLPRASGQRICQQHAAAAFLAQIARYWWVELLLGVLWAVIADAT